MNKETYQGCFVKKATQRKTAFMASLFALSLSIATTSVHAYIEQQNFWSASTESGGIVTFQDTNTNQLTITFDNTSNYSAIITGIVFNITQTIQNASILSFVDGNNQSIANLWSIALGIDSNISPGNTTFDVTFTSNNGINGGIFNTGVATNTDNAFPDIATLILEISSPVPWTFTDVANDSILRTQRTGADGQGSDKIVTSSSSTSGAASTTSGGTLIPEPAILGLLGIGLLAQAFAFASRRRRLDLQNQTLSC